MRGFLAIGMVIFVAACGGGGGSPGGDAVTADEAEDYCRPACERDEACNPDEPAEACTAECAAEVAGWMSEAALATWTECVAELDCALEPNSCLGGVMPRPIHEEFEAACRAKACPEEACEVTADDPNGVDDGLIRFLADDIVEEMIGCFDTAADCIAALICINEIQCRYIPSEGCL